jgi:signal transduction histidine kinase
LQGNVQIAQRLLTRLTRQTKNLLPGEQRMLQDVLTLLGRSQQQLHVQNRLINDLLTITYIEQDKLELFQTEVDLIRLIDETVRDFQAAYPSRRIETHLPEQDALVVYADRDRLQQVVSNFLTNALKFAPEHEPVEIGITPEARTIRVWVRDHGAGLAPEQQERIWQRFYQSPETRTQGEWKGGLGLGLYICYHLIHSQQGQIGVDSTPGDGATFWFTLPLYGS